MCHSHSFNTIANKLTACKRILHSNMSHSNAVANSNCGNKNGSTACHSDTCLNRLCNFVKVEMSRYYLTMRAYNTDKRTLKLLFCVAHSIK